MLEVRDLDLAYGEARALDRVSLEVEEGEIVAIVGANGAGKSSLIRAIAEHSRIPVLKHYRGVCHLYVHDDADLDMALNIAVNAKCQRPGVCNAIETLLVHEAVAAEFLARWIPAAAPTDTAPSRETTR